MVIPSAAAAMAAEPQPAFQAFNHFAGHKPGYVFTRGSQGQGYYADRRAALLAQSAQHGIRQHNAATATKKERSNKFPGKGKSAPAASDAAPASMRKRGGILGTSKAELDAARSGTDTEDSDLSDTRGRTRPVETMAKRKALPGRLRKKLAKQAMAQA